MSGEKEYGRGRNREDIALVPHLLDIPHKKIWIDYDEEADVLYLNFRKPSHADDSELTDDDTVIRYEKGQVVGITYLNAKKRRKKSKAL